ncbi:MAG: septum site-determining protein MinC [Clostridia bacterium]|nr:septum site-determining protein MinC [Clostridia bacterium]
MAPISIKGTRGGLVIQASRQYTFEEIKKDLTDKLDSARGFFKGARFNLSSQSKLKTEQYRTLEHICIKRGMIPDANISLTSQRVPAAKSEGEAPENKENVILHRTIRSGQKVFSNGDLVIIGNVNPGAELIAEGSIVVMGSLWGMAHAGASGDKDASIVAQNMQPSQIRIGGLVACKPDHDRLNGDRQEIAYIVGGKIVVDEYHRKHEESIIA